MADRDQDETARKLDFYVSYAGKDRLWAEWVAHQLKHAGYEVELDVWDWLPGRNIILASESALDRADRVLAVCSAAYFGGGFPEQEWTAVMAARDGTPNRLVPVWIDDLQETQLPGLLRPVQPIKLFGVTKAEARRRLVAGLAGDLGPDGEPRFPGSVGPATADRDESAEPRLPSRRRPATWRVPPHNPDFTGRDGLLVQVREALLGTSPGMVVLQGPGGVGKTQLSIEYAHRFAADYDTVWVIDSANPDLIVSQLAELAVKIGAATPVADAQSAATAAIAALRDSSRWLLVFDNVEGPDQFAGLVPDGPGHVLVTTRTGEWQEIGRLISVQEFSRAESTTLLTSKVAALAPDDADRVADALGDLPLGLVQAIGVLQSGLPTAEFERLLHGQATQVLSRGKPRSYEASLAAATLIALDKLAAAEPEAANLLCLGSYLAPEPVPAIWFSQPDAYRSLPGAAQVSPLPGEVLATTHAYARIRDIGLGRVDQEGLRLHRLTQAIVRDHTADRASAYRNVGIAILAAAAPKDSDDPANWPAWSRLVPHLLALPLEDAPAALRSFVSAAARYLLASGQARAALALTTRLYQRWAAQLGPDDPDTLTAAQHLAHAIHDAGDHAGALELHRDTLARRQRQSGPDDPDTLQSANDLAVNLSSMGQFEAAEALHEDTYERRRRVLGDDHPETVTAASNLGAELNNLKRYKEALPLQQDAYERRRRAMGEDHPHTLAFALNLASGMFNLRQSKKALTLLQNTYDRSRRVLGDDHPTTLDIAGQLAKSLDVLGMHAAAVRVRAQHPVKRPKGKNKKR